MRIFLGVLVLLLACNEVSQTTEIEILDSHFLTQNFEENEDLDFELETENLIIIDFNSDSLPDSVFIIPPRLIETDDEISNECVGGTCITKISFLGKWPGIFVDQSVGGEIKFLDDINDNGYRELVFFPYWFQSCWSRMDIFSFNGKTWSRIQTIDYNCCDDEFPNLFEKIDHGLLRVVTNGEKMEETISDFGDTLRDFSGIEARVYEVIVP